jgi:uncharacterized protein (TIGR03437 family)
MKSVLLLTTVLHFSLALIASSVPSELVRNRPLSGQKPLIDTRVRLPLVFEPNVGQAAPEVQWISRTGDGTMLLEPGRATLIVRGSHDETRRITMNIVGAREPSTEALEPLTSFSSYFIGNDPARWRKRIPHYSKIRYKNVYPGIDLLYYGTDRRLEYDFVLSPGTTHSVIELAFDGADRLRVDPNGDLMIQTGGVTVRQFKPKVYQWTGGKQQFVAGAYRISRSGNVQFALGSYDRSRPLVIDPVLQYSTYVGGSGHEKSTEIATDKTGAIYITGYTTSGDLKSSLRDQPNFSGKFDGMVAKLSSFGDRLEWISYYGGKENDLATSIAVDSGGNAIIAGWTESADLPIRNPARETHSGATDAFVAKLNPTGTDLVYSTFLGGSRIEQASDIAVDSAGAAYVSGWTWSPNFPVVNSFQSGPAGGGGDVFITKLPASGSPIAYSTYVGGSGDDIGTGIAVDSRGAVYVTGGTTSTVFPTMRPVQAQNRGKYDVFLFKLQPNGNTLEYSTFLGGSLDDLGNRVSVDPSGNAYVSGYTLSTDFPTKSAFQPSFGGGKTDVFIFKINATGSAVDYASYLGGDAEDSGQGELAVDNAGSAYITGFTASSNFPTRTPFQAKYGGGNYDAFITRVSPAGNTLLYSSFLGGSGDDNGYGIVVDPQGAVTVSGWTASPDLPSAAGSFNAGGASPADVFVARISADTSVSLLGVGAGSLVFTGPTGQDPPAQTLAITSTGLPLTFTAGANVPWLRVVADKNTTPATLTVTAATAGLAAGAHTGEITINSPGALTAIPPIRVTLNLSAVPVVTSVSPAALPRNQESRLTITGSGFITTSEVFAGSAKLQANFLNATTLTATIPAALVTGAAPLQLIVRNPDVASQPFIVQVGTATPAIVSTGIVNTATMLPGSASPGQLVSILGRDFGPDRPASSVPDAAGVLGSMLAETRVLFDGIAAPVISVSSNQVNVIVPSALTGWPSAQVEVEFRGQRSIPVTLGIGPATPGLFTANMSGTGQAAALNQNFSPNSPANPVARGSIVILYATGYGLTNPAATDGAIASTAAPPANPVLPLNVTIGNTPAEVVFAGTAPGLVSGVAQLNVRVPENATAGDAVPVVLTVGAAESRAGVTIAVR